MRVLGLDPGSRRTGYGLVEKSGNRLRCVAHGDRAPAAPPRPPAAPARDRHPRRRADRAATPRRAWWSRRRSTTRASARRWCWATCAGHCWSPPVQRGIEVAEYSPREIKMSVTGNGAAAKEQVAFMVHAPARAHRGACRPTRRTPWRARSATSSARGFRRPPVPPRRPRTRLEALLAADRAPARAELIASLRGTLAGIDGRARAWSRPGGVGYLVHVSTHTAQALPEPRRARCSSTPTRWCARTRTCCSVSPRSRSAACSSCSSRVSGVGPKVALGVLSGLKPRGAGARDPRREHGGAGRHPGVGRKTAERLIVELRDKIDVRRPLGAEARRRPARQGRGVPPRSERFDDAVAALVKLGYSRPQAQDADRGSVAEGGGVLSLEDLVRRALARLGKVPRSTRSAD